MIPESAGPVLQQLLEGPEEAADGRGAGGEAPGQEGRAARQGTAQRAVSAALISATVRLESECML